MQLFLITKFRNKSRTLTVGALGIFSCLFLFIFGYILIYLAIFCYICLYMPIWLIWLMWWASLLLKGYLLHGLSGKAVTDLIYRLPLSEYNVARAASVASASVASAASSPPTLRSYCLLANIIIKIKVS